MPGETARNQARRCAGLVAAALVVSVAWTVARAEEGGDVRALWVVRTSLTSPASIQTMVDAARDGGFNTLLVQVRGRGDAYYLGGLEPRPPDLEGLPGFDPLATTIARAHAVGLNVHAWVNVSLVAGVNELPSAREHVVYRHPEWLMVPRALAADLSGVDPHSPEYLGRLSRYVRSQPKEIEGLYVSPIPAAAVDYTVAVVRDIVTRYAVDGVHFDYARYPTDDFDYGREALAAFRDDVTRDLKPADRRRYDARLGAEPLVYAKTFAERWRAFRASRLTELIARLGDAVRAARPGTLVSVAVGPNADESAVRRLQDWPAWVAGDLVDVICPMAYTADERVFASQITAARQIAGSHPVWAGIGAYRLSQAEIARNVQTARRLGVGGIILFSYDSLTDPARGPDFLAEVGRAFATRQF